MLFVIFAACVYNNPNVFCYVKLYKEKFIMTYFKDVTLYKHNEIYVNYWGELKLAFCRIFDAEYMISYIFLCVFHIYQCITLKKCSNPSKWNVF